MCTDPFIFTEMNTLDYKYYKVLNKLDKIWGPASLSYYIANESEADLDIVGATDVSAHVLRRYIWATNYSTWKLVDCAL